MGFMAGNLFVRDIEAAPAQLSLSDVRVGPEGSFLELRFEEAVALFAERHVLPPDEFYRLLGDLRARAFTAKLLATDRLRVVAYERLLQALEGGGDFDSFALAIASEEVSLGVEPSSHGYLRTVFDTNVVSAYSAGRDRQLTEPVVIEVLPYRVYQAVLDARTRPSHAALNGKVWDARVTDEWRKFQGPNGFNCRCMCVSAAEGDFRVDEVALSRVAEHPDPGFDAPPRL